MQNIQYKIFYHSILHHYLSASSLKVFWKFLRLRMQSTEGFQVNDHLIAMQELSKTCRLIFSLPAQKPLAAQSLLQTWHVHTIATSARGRLIINFTIAFITVGLINVIIFKARFCCNRVITEWVQTLTLPGLIKKIILQHFENLQGSRTNYHGVKLCIRLQQYISKGLKPYLCILFAWETGLYYDILDQSFISTVHNFFSYEDSWSSFSILRFLVIRLWCAATRSSCIDITGHITRNWEIISICITLGLVIVPWVEHTLGAKLPPALLCWVVRRQAPHHLMLPLASRDV